VLATALLPKRSAVALGALALAAHALPLLQPRFGFVDILVPLAPNSVQLLYSILKHWSLVLRDARIGG
jgi:hypothetical protein